MHMYSKFVIRMDTKMYLKVNVAEISESRGVTE